MKSEAINSLKAGLLIGGLGFVAGGVTVSKLMGVSPGQVRGDDLVEAQYREITDLRIQNFTLSQKLRHQESATPLVIYGPGKTAVATVKTKNSTAKRAVVILGPRSARDAFANAPQGNFHSRFGEEILFNRERQRFPGLDDWRRFDQKFSIENQHVEVAPEGTFRSPAQADGKPEFEHDAIPESDRLESVEQMAKGFADQGIDAAMTKERNKRSKRRNRIKNDDSEPVDSPDKLAGEFYDAIEKFDRRHRLKVKHKPKQTDHGHKSESMASDVVN
jgi:hypothetical protein